MPFVPAENVAQVELRQRLDDQRVENTLYFLKTVPISIGDLETISDVMRLWWEEALAPQVSLDLTLVEVFVTDLTTDTSPTFSNSPSSPIPGEIAKEALPNNVALCVSFRTAGRGRSSRGRNYVAGLDIDSVLHNTVDPSRVEGIANAYQDITPRLDGLLFDWVVVSRFSGGVPRSAALVQPITSVIVVDPTVDSQRRRLPGRGT